MPKMPWRGNVGSFRDQNEVSRVMKQQQSHIHLSYSSNGSIYGTAQKHMPDVYIYHGCTPTMKNDT